MLTRPDPIGDLIAPEPLDFFDDGLVAELSARARRAGPGRDRDPRRSGAPPRSSPTRPPRLLGRAPGRGGAGAGGDRQRDRGRRPVDRLVHAARSPRPRGSTHPDYFTRPRRARGARLRGARALARLPRGAWPLRCLAGAGAAAAPPRLRAALAAAATVCFLLPAAFTDASLPDALPFIAPRPPARDLRRLRRGRQRAHPGVDFTAQYAALLPYALWPVLSLTDYSPARSRSLPPASRRRRCWPSGARWRSSPATSSRGWRSTCRCSRSASCRSRRRRRAAHERLAVPAPARALPAAAAHRLAARPSPPRARARGVGGADRASPALAAAQQPGVRPSLPAGDGDRPGARPPRRGLAVAELWPLLARAAVARALGCRGALSSSRSTSCAPARCPTPDAVLYLLAALRLPGLRDDRDAGARLSIWRCIATFAGALIVAAVRAREPRRRPRPDRLLGFAGAFGLLVCVYYGGRSNAYSMIGVFPAWGLALALLAWLVLRPDSTAPRAGRRPAARRGARGLRAGRLRARGDHGDRRPAAVAAAEPARRLHASGDEPVRPRGGRALRRRAAPSREPIAIIGPNGFLIARDLGVRDVSPIEDPVHLVAGNQVQDVIDALERGRELDLRPLTSPFPPPAARGQRVPRRGGFRPVAELRRAS